MKILTITKKLILAVFLASFFGLTAFTQTVNQYSKDGSIYLRLNSQSKNVASEGKVVNLADAYFLNDLIADYGITSIAKTFYATKSEELQKTFLVKFTEINKVEELITKLEKNNNVEYAEKAPLFKLFFTPDDADYAADVENRWHLDVINAEAAWEITHGSRDIKVAVLDNAMDMTHPDLASKFDTLIDLGDDDFDTNPPNDELEWGHGSHTSGLVAGATNNGIGIAGIGFDTGLMGVKVGNDADGGMSAGFEGITWAADNGADVISMSWGSPQYMQTMQTVVTYAYSQGCVLVAAAGNDGQGNNEITYPAACDHVISVGSTDGDDKMSTFSQYGTWVDLCAPGGYVTSGILDMLLGKSVYSTHSQGRYVKMQGTSMACPIAAGLCALMLSENPDLTPDRLEQLLKESCDDISAQNTGDHAGMYGAGRINAEAAVIAAEGSVRAITADFTSDETYILFGNSINFFDRSTDTATTWAWTFDGGVPATSADQNPTGINYADAGSFTVTLVVTNANGDSDTAVKENYIISSSGNAASAWIEQATGFETASRGVDNIVIVDQNTVWATAINGVATTNEDYYTFDFSKTIDGGATWTPGVFSGMPSTYQISSLTAISADKAWFSAFNTASTADKGGIYVTEDGGTSWTKQATAAFDNSSSFPNVVHFWNANDGWCMGDPANDYYEFYTTTDGGTTWTRVPTANIPAPISGEYGYTGMYEVVDDIIWFGTNKGRVLKSIDKGLNWTVSQTDLTDMQDVAFNDASNGYVIQKVYDQTSGEITSHTLQVTHDGGTTWSTVTTYGNFWLTDMDAVPGYPGLFVSVGNDGSGQNAPMGSSYTYNYGVNWYDIDETVQYISTKFLNSDIGWAGSFAISQSVGGIFKWQESVLSIGDIVANEKENNLNIYPNPSNGFVNIAIHNIESNNVNLQVIDITGRVVYSNIQNTNNGSLNTSIDLSNIDKGIYIVIAKSNTSTLKQRIIIE